MILVGLTGGIGAGKSTVSVLLAERGAVIVDADQQAEYPGDRFFEFVPALQEAEIRLPAS